MWSSTTTSLAAITRISVLTGQTTLPSVHHVAYWKQEIRIVVVNGEKNVASGRTICPIGTLSAAVLEE